MKLLTHSQDKVGDFQDRVLLHIPVGLLMGIPVMGIPLLLLFRQYERNEDRWCKDQAWKDIYGAMVGVVVTMLVTLGLIVWILIRQIF